MGNGGVGRLPHRPEVAMIGFTLEKHNGITVVRDDLIPGGTKQRILRSWLDENGPGEYVYASPSVGYAQLALAYTCAGLKGYKATIFIAKRRDYSPITEKARRAGATIMPVSPGYLSVVQNQAKVYCMTKGAFLLPFGFDSPEVVSLIAMMASEVPYTPSEVWSVAGSGTLTRGLQQAWPGAFFHAVQVGRPPKTGTARLWVAPEPFDKPAADPPPFPSSPFYDAKAWQFVRSHAEKGALFWNVAA